MPRPRSASPTPVLSLGLDVCKCCLCDEEWLPLADRLPLLSKSLLAAPSRKPSCSPPKRAASASTASGHPVGSSAIREHHGQDFSREVSPHSSGRRCPGPGCRLTLSWGGPSWWPSPCVLTWPREFPGVPSSYRGADLSMRTLPSSWPRLT